MSAVKKPARVVGTVLYEQTGIVVGDFTDGGAAVGTLTLGFQLPVGFWIDRCVIKNLTGFTGDTSATVQVGDGSDVDRLTTGTPSVFTTATYVNLGAPSGTLPISTAFAPVVTITSGSDWGAVVAGGFDIQIYGWSLD
jgi:hypothetical protein